MSDRLQEIRNRLEVVKNYPLTPVGEDIAFLLRVLQECETDAKNHIAEFTAEENKLRRQLQEAQDKIDTITYNHKAAEIELQEAQKEYAELEQVARNFRVDIASLRLDNQQTQDRERVLHQALEQIKNNPKLWKAGRAGGQDQYAGLPPAIRVIDEVLGKVAKTCLRG